MSDEIVFRMARRLHDDPDFQARLGDSGCLDPDVCLYPGSRCVEPRRCSYPRLLWRAAAAEAAKALSSVRWHQAHRCWCGETHDLFEADELNDAIEDEEIARLFAERDATRGEESVELDEAMQWLGFDPDEHDVGGQQG